MHLGAGEKRDIDDTAVFCRCADIPVDIVATDHIQNHIDALPVSRLQYRIDKIRLPVINRQCCAQLFTGAAFFITACGGEHFHPHGIGYLDRRGTDPG